LSANELPFNLAGELLEESASAEGEARAKAQAESEANKAQGELPLVINVLDLNPDVAERVKAKVLEKIVRRLA
jgi:hypothetical protein